MSAAEDRQALHEFNYGHHRPDGSIALRDRAYFDAYRKLRL